MPIEERAKIRLECLKLALQISKNPEKVPKIMNEFLRLVLEE